MPLLPHHVPWFVVGPLIGLVPVALYAMANRPLGASGAYLQTVLALRGRATEGWRAWFFVGLIVGVLLAAVLQGGPDLHLGYYFISGSVSPVAAIPILFVSGLGMGYGARWGRWVHLGTRPLRNIGAGAWQLRRHRDFLLNRDRGHPGAPTGDGRPSMNRVGLVFGIAFGFLIAAAGFGDADFIHRMLLLQNWYPYLVFGSAVATAMPVLWLLQRGRWVTPLGGPLKLVQAKAGRRQLYGGALFGVGWAFSCTCPVPALAMVFSGGVLGIPVVAGLFSGILLGDRRAHARPRAATITAAAWPAT